MTVGRQDGGNGGEERGLDVAVVSEAAGAAGVLVGTVLAAPSVTGAVVDVSVLGCDVGG